MRADLAQIEIPGAAEAEERASRVVLAAFAERMPDPVRRRRAFRPVVAVAVGVAIVAAALSPPGRAVVNHVRRVVGIDHASLALFSLPAQGRLLVRSDAGIWTVRADGSRRLLGRYDEASWSPFGRYVVAARQNELAALDSRGTVRWTLARPDVRFPRWAGSQSDTRIAYLTGSRLHVVAGDGTQDVDIGGLPAAARVAPAWQNGFGFVLAYADTRSRVTAFMTSKGSLLWTRATPDGTRSVEWSSDGEQLLVLSDDRISTRTASTGAVIGSRPAAGVVAVAFRPGTHEIAALRLSPSGSQVRFAGRTLFSFAGALRGLTWSPDGRWLLVGSPESDQWVFVRADGRKIVAVSNVSAQFGSKTFPRVEGWCCGT